MHSESDSARPPGSGRAITGPGRTTGPGRAGSSHTTRGSRAGQRPSSAPQSAQRGASRTGATAGSSLPLTVWIRPSAAGQEWREWAAAEVIAAFLPPGRRLRHLSAAAATGTPATAGGGEGSDLPDAPLGAGTALSPATGASRPSSTLGGTQRAGCGRSCVVGIPHLTGTPPAGITDAHTRCACGDQVTGPPGGPTATAADLVLADLGPGPVPGEFGQTAAHLLAPGGVLAVLTHSHRTRSGLLDPTGPIVSSCQHADLLHLQHIVLALHSLRPGPHTARRTVTPSTATPGTAAPNTAPPTPPVSAENTTPVTAVGDAAVDGVPAHADLLVFTRPPDTSATDPDPVSLPTLGSDRGHGGHQGGDHGHDSHGHDGRLDGELAAVAGGYGGPVGFQNAAHAPDQR
jgi:hypothetical protein